MNANSDNDQSISVIIRIKGKTPEELNEDSSLIKVKNNNKILIESKKKEFFYDYVGDKDSTQNDIFEHCGKKICDHSLEGYNTTIFAYGQTGSGKTYTLLGKKILKDSENKNINNINKNNISKLTSSEDIEMTDDSIQNNNNEYSYDINDEKIGLLPRILYYLFEKTNSFEKEENKFLFKISYLEIYNENMKDLLNPDSKQKVQLSDIKGVVTVQNLRKLIISSPEEAIKYIIDGNKLRKTAETLMNNESSRSHAIISIYIENKLIKENKIKKSVFHIIDLAGSERINKTGAVGERAKEGGKINKSLLNLSRVIISIIKNEKQISYRDSKLTHILRDSIGGNAKTSIIATISQLDRNIDETIYTLYFAQNAKKIKNNAIINEELSENDAKILKETIKNLQMNYNLVLKKYSDLKKEKQIERNSINERENFSKNLEIQNEEINKLMKDILEKEKNLKQLEMENDNLKDKIEKDDIEFKIKDKEIKEIKEKINKINEKNDFLLKENKELKNAINFLEEKLKKNENNIQNIVENHKKELLEKDKILQAKKSHNDEIQKELKEKINLYEEKIKSLNDEFNKNKQLLDSKNKKINEMEEIIIQKEKLNEELNNNKNSYVNEINEYKSELEKTNKNNMEIKTKGKEIITKYEEKIKLLSEELNKKIGEIKILKDTFSQNEKKINSINKIIEAMEEEKNLLNSKLKSARDNIELYLDTITILQQDKITLENNREAILEEKEKEEKNSKLLYDISGKQQTINNNLNGNNNINNREYIQLKKENEKLKRNYEKLIKNIEPKNEAGSFKIKEIQDLVDKLSNNEKELNEYKNSIKKNIDKIGQAFDINVNDYIRQTTLKNKLNSVIQLIVDILNKKNDKIQSLNDEKELLLKNINTNNIKQSFAEILNIKTNINKNQGNINCLSAINKIRTKESFLSKNGGENNKNKKLKTDINFSFNKENESINFN